MGLLDRFKKNKEIDNQSQKSDKDQKFKANQEVKEGKKSEYSSLKTKDEESAPVVSVKNKEGKAVKRTKENTKDAYKIFVRPIVTEKATDLGSLNKYCFEVFKSTNKIEIKKAIKDLYGVEAVDVNIVYSKGKKVRYGRVTGKKKNWKKAIVTLKEGDKIEVYEGV